MMEITANGKKIMVIDDNGEKLILDKDVQDEIDFNKIENDLERIKKELRSPEKALAKKTLGNKNK